MEKIIEYLSELNLVTTVIRLVLAMIVGGVVGIERGKQGRAAGMRTHILVCVGSALTVMIGIYMYNLGMSTDPMRISAQVISGIGFLGVGTILLKGRFQITGLTTAAGLWAKAARADAITETVNGFTAGTKSGTTGIILTVTAMQTQAG